jgi:hypothetical protein
MVFPANAGIRAIRIRTAAIRHFGKRSPSEIMGYLKPSQIKDFDFNPP